jgi:hypothetical protein
MRAVNSKIIKRLLAAAVAVALSAFMGVTALADSTSTDTGTGTVSSTIPITGTINPLQISITHPVSEAYSIDPNAGTFTAPAVAIQNNTKVPVNVTVQSLSSITGGTLQFQDVAPDAKTWSALNASDSKKYIALGINISTAAGWNAGYSTATDWAATSAPVLFGSVNSGATGNFNLTAKYGTAFDGSYTAKHNLVFMFQLV